MATSDSTDFHPELQLHIEGEEWRPVVGYEGVYEVSDLGRVRRSQTGRSTFVGKVLRTGPKPAGYRFVILCSNAIQKNRTVHSLVAEAFLGQRPEGAVINHIDGDKTNNHIVNLEYVTPKQNIHHALLNGLMGSMLPDDVVSNILALIKQDDPHLTYGQIAEIVGVHESTVSTIARGKIVGYELRGFKKAVEGERRKIKLTSEDYEKIKRLLAEGKMSQRKIAQLYGVHEGTVSHIKSGTYSFKRGAK